MNLSVCEQRRLSMSRLWKRNFILTFHKMLGSAALNKMQRHYANAVVVLSVRLVSFPSILHLRADCITVEMSLYWELHGSHWFHGIPMGMAIAKLVARQWQWEYDHGLTGMGGNENSAFYYFPPTTSWSSDTVSGPLFLHRPSTLS